MEPQLKARRAELLAEDYLQDLSPSLLVKAENAPVPFDFMIGLSTPDGGLKYLGIDVKQTEAPVQGEFHFRSYRGFLQKTKSNMPIVILVVDTKRNDIYYGFASRAQRGDFRLGRSPYYFYLPVRHAGPSQADKQKLKDELLEA